MNASDETSGRRRVLAAWYRASRPPFYIATLIPLVLGLVLAHEDTGLWRWGRFALINLASFMVHLATNLADDLFDHILGADAGESIGGSRGIQQGLITPVQLAWALIFLYAASLLTAGALVRLTDQPLIWPLAALAGFSSLFYVAPPVKYGYRGLGELFVFLNMGLIMVAGTYLVQTGRWSFTPVWFSLPVGLMVAGILYFQSLPDMETDLRVGKITLAVRLGRYWARQVLRLNWILVYATMIGLNLAGLADWPVWGCLATLPLLLKADRLAGETRDWRELDQHGHLIRKLYLVNGALIIWAAA